MPKSVGRFTDSSLNKNPNLLKDRLKKAQGRVSKVLYGSKVDEDKSLDWYTNQMDRDYQVTLARRTLEANIKSIPVSISVTGDDRAKKLGDRLQELWTATISTMMEGIAKGRVAYEKMWDFDEENNLTYISSLENLPFSMTEMEIEDGVFQGIKLTPRGGKETKEVTIPVDKSWWLALYATILEPHGKSLYMGAPFETWKTRKETLRLREVFIKRFVLNWAKAHVPPTKEDEDGEIIDNFTAVADAYETARSGGIVLFDNDKDEHGNYIEDIDQMPELKTVAPIDEAVATQDAEQIRSFGFSEKTVTEGDSVGSFAMVKQQTILLYAICLDILSEIAKSFQEFVIGPSIDKNWEKIGLYRPEIKLIHPIMAEVEGSFVQEFVTNLLTSPTLSPIVKSGAIDLLKVLDQIGVPVVDDAESLIEKALSSTSSSPFDNPFSTGLNNSNSSGSGLGRFGSMELPFKDVKVPDNIDELGTVPAGN